MRWLCFYSAITLTFLMATVRFDSHLVAAELSPEHSRLVKEVNDAIVAAGKSYASGNYDASGEQIEKAMQRLTVAVSKGGQEALTELGPAIQRIEKAHTLLQFEGISLTPFRIPKLTDSKSDSTKSMEPVPAVPKPQPVTPEPSPKPAPTPGDGEMMISF